MGIESGFWNKLKPFLLQYSLKQIRSVIATDRPDPTVAIDAFLQFVQAYKACWAAKAKNGTITSFEPIVKNAIEKCLELDALFKHNGMRTIWCLDGDKSASKLATERRREKREGKRNMIFKYYCTIVALKTASAANDLSAFKRRYAIIEQNIPDDFPREELSDLSMADMENKLASEFKNEGFFPPDLAGMITRGMKASSRSPTFMCVPAISEGEKLASILTQTGAAQAVYSTDGDCVILGARFIIKEISAMVKDRPVGMYHLYSYARITRGLGMNHKQLLILAILLGNDFNTKVPGEGIVTCEKNAANENFDILSHNIKNLGCLNVGACLKEYSVSKFEFDSAVEALELMSQ